MIISLNKCTRNERKRAHSTCEFNFFRFSSFCLVYCVVCVYVCVCLKYLLFFYVYFVFEKKEISQTLLSLSKQKIKKVRCTGYIQKRITSVLITCLRNSEYELVNTLKAPQFLRASMHDALH